MKQYILNAAKEGSGSTLVLIHGVAGSLHIWDPIVEELALHNTVFRVDLLGYGHSPKPRIAYSPEAHIEAIRNTLKQYGLEPPYTLIGLSMGVNLALEFAARYPQEIKAFVGIGFPYYHDESAARKGLHNNIWTGLTLEHPGVARFFIPTVWWLGRVGILPTQSFTKIYSPIMAKDTLLNTYYAFRSSLWLCMVKEPQDELLMVTEQLPKLFIHGTDDTWASPREVQKAIAPYSWYHLETVQDAGHNVVVLEPKLTIKLLTSYLKKDNKNSSG